MRILIYEAIPDINKAPFFAELTIKLQKQGHDVLLVLEKKLIYTLDNQLTKKGVINCQSTIANYIATNPALTYTMLPAPADFYSEVDTRTLLTSLKKVSALRSQYYSEVLSAYNPDYVMIWNGGAEHQSDFIKIITALNQKLLYIEHGWFPQSKTIYLDPLGVNGGSLLSKTEPHTLTPEQSLKVIHWREKYTSDKNRYSTKTNHIFIPLQVDSDTNISIYSPFGSMKEFISYLEHWLPSDYSATFRPHPLGNYSYQLESTRENFSFDSTSPIEQLILESSECIGINSTVLLQSIVYGKPTSAFGQAIFSNSKCIKLLKMNTPFTQSLRINEIVIDQFLYHLVFEKQITIGDYDNILEGLFGEVKSDIINTTYNQYHPIEAYFRKLIHIVGKRLYLKR